MDKRIASPQFTSDHEAKELMRQLEDLSASLQIEDPVFYYDFPLFRDDELQLYRSTVIFASRSHGLFVFSTLRPTIDVEELEEQDEKLNQLDSLLFSKFIKSSALRKSKRGLKFAITPILFLPEQPQVGQPEDLENQIVFSPHTLKQVIEQHDDGTLSEFEWHELVAQLEGTKAISRPEVRKISAADNDSWAAVIKSIEERIANFDREQRRAALTIVDGPQRIRGIAGSGKTIVLAMKAAHLHLQNPEKLILFTFWTKSLYDLIKQQITRFYRQFSDADPDWEKLHILHAWGGRNQPGVYSNACIENGLRSISFREIPSYELSKFGYVCSKSFSTFLPSQKYDFVLIDEGQDLPSSFYRLCFSLCQGGDIDRNLIWAYDELQTIMDARLQDVSETFGQLPDGNPRIDLRRAQETLSEDRLLHDIVLRKSYRNPPEILMCAHALGMGIYGPTIVQILENPEHWSDLGYVVEEGSCEAGEDTVIFRPPENSPLSITDHIPVADVIACKEATDFDDETAWVVSNIKRCLAEGLQPEDVMVISLDDRNARGYFNHLAQKLSQNDIDFNNVHESYASVPKFFIEGQVTLTTIYKAKGNEAPVVFVVGADAVGRFLDDIKARNKLFTAFTRSKGWLRVSGMGQNVRPILNELHSALANYPRMKFIYPDPAQIQTIQRDLAEKSAKLRELQLKFAEFEDSDLTEDEIIEALRAARKKS